VHKLSLIAVAAVCALAAAAPTALAQTTSLSATYTDKFEGPTGHPTCAGDGFGCGSGTAAEFGAFTDEYAFNGDGTFTRTLTFADGSTLALLEVRTVTSPGASGSMPRPETSRDDGNPGNYLSTWTVAAGTGSFAGASGSGTDDFLSAGAIGFGTIAGTITTH
jgi:hypothetical protein